MKTPSKASMYQQSDTVSARVGFRVCKVMDLAMGNRYKIVYDGDRPVWVCFESTLERFLEKGKKEKIYFYEIFTTELENRFIYWKELWDGGVFGYLAELPKEEEKKEANDGAETEHDGK